MLKAYLRKWQRNYDTLATDYWFTGNRDIAACWKTKTEADADCALLFNGKITIPSSLGGTHLCDNFQSEERGPGEVVVFCIAPFIPKNLGMK